MKFARNVYFQFKTERQLTQLTDLGKEVLPMLRKQDGF